ncbi:energy transducer TonB [Burkholderia plantarii]|uniref:energy transducer TonB n=1 Tax=Burkholderia plantarii TaxID=41899 RepID=UPI0018DE6886|nr:energy transducer TonB [Burkholderia plantarii]MBI0331305.1 TonB C-terminal domain-containing protein [Burkholderia plantarii]
MPTLPGSVVRIARHAAGAAALALLAACAQGGGPATGAAAPAAASAPKAPATPLSGAAPLTLEHANTDAFVAQYGIDPDSPKAAILAHWRQKMLDDPDIRRLFGNAGPSELGRSIAMQRTELFSEGSLRVSQADRSTFIALGTRVLDAAPADCGGLKNMNAVVLRYLSLANLSEHEIDDYFRITYESLKRTALKTPIATINTEQRSQGKRALSAAIGAQLQRDPEAMRSLAIAAADPENTPPAAWCRNMRTMQHAVMAMPQPQRDWLLISIQTDAIARLHADDATATPAAPSSSSPPSSSPVPAPDAAAASPEPDAATPAYLARLQRRIVPLIAWHGAAGHYVAELEIRSAADGTLQSAAIVRSSGNAGWDDAVLRAVRAASPLPPDAGGGTPAAFRLTVRAAQ